MSSIAPFLPIIFPLPLSVAPRFLITRSPLALQPSIAVSLVVFSVSLPHVNISLAASFSPAFSLSFPAVILFFTLVSPMFSPPLVFFVAVSLVFLLFLSLVLVPFFFIIKNHVIPDTSSRRQPKVF